MATVNYSDPSKLPDLDAHLIQLLIEEWFRQPLIYNFFRDIPFRSTEFDYINLEDYNLKFANYFRRESYTPESGKELLDLIKSSLGEWLYSDYTKSYLWTRLLINENYSFRQHHLLKDTSIVRKLAGYRHKAYGFNYNENGHFNFGVSLIASYDEEGQNKPVELMDEIPKSIKVGDYQFQYIELKKRYTIPSQIQMEDSELASQNLR